MLVKVGFAVSLLSFVNVNANFFFLDFIFYDFSKLFIGKRR